MKFTEIKILTDENISPGIVLFLRRKGFDVLDTKEQNWYGKDNKFMINKLYISRRFIMTQVSDFGTLVVNKRENFFGVIYLRPKNSKTNNVINMLSKSFNLVLEIEKRTIIVISEEKIKLRKIPEKTQI